PAAFGLGYRPSNLNRRLGKSAGGRLRHIAHFGFPPESIPGRLPAAPSQLTLMRPWASSCGAGSVPQPSKTQPSVPPYASIARRRHRCPVLEDGAQTLARPQPPTSPETAGHAPTPVFGI